MLEQSAITSDKAGARSSGITHVNRLLQTLKDCGRMDAHELEEATGIKLSVVIATLFTAGARGQVTMSPAKEDPVYKARGRRGQIYEFLSFDPVQRPRLTKREQSAEVMTELETVLMPGLRDTLRTLVSVSSVAVVRRFDWAKELNDVDMDPFDSPSVTRKAFSKTKGSMH